MQFLALRPGDSAWAVNKRFYLRYVGMQSCGCKLELTFADRSVFTVVTGKSVSVTTVWANVPEEFVMRCESQLRIGGELLTIRELSKGKIAVNYFGDGQFVAVPLVEVELVESGSLIGQR